MEKKCFGLKWSLLFVSALLGALPFIMPHVCAELIFIFLIPLYYLVIKNYALGFKEGFFWGVVFYGIYFHGLVVLIMHHGVGSYRLLAGIALVLYGAFCAGVWFYLCKQLEIFFSTIIKIQIFEKIFAWIIGSFFYFYCVDTVFFIIFGFWEGDQLRSLFVPLAVRFQWLLISRFLPKFVELLLLIVFSAACACFFVADKRRRLFFVGALISCMPFVAGWLVFCCSHRDLDEPSFLSSLCCIAPQTIDDDPWVAHEHICDLLHACSHIKTVRFLILPESSFPFALNEWHRCITSWYDCLNNDDMYIIIGSHRQKNKKIFNTAYVLHNRRIINYYDKNHTMFFTERVPPFWSYLFKAKNLFLKNQKPFSQGKKERPRLSLPSLGIVMPYICSELFFEATGPSQVAGDNILCLVNDSWFFCSYIAQLMLLHAIRKALYEQKNILYVSYYYHKFISHTGILWDLNQKKGIVSKG